MHNKSLKHKIDDAVTKVILQESDQSGYTIIESLVAMIVVAVLMSAVAPVIALSVGTRVQARRVELATQAAKSYIDWVRNDIASNTPNLIVVELEDAPAPNSGGLTCNDNQYCTIPAPAIYNDLYCVDGDGDGNCTNDSLTDMVVQGMRRHPNSNDASLGYALGVRVYRADAFQEITLCGPALENPTALCPTRTQQSTITNAIGNRRLPVLQLTTEISPTQSSFQNLCDRIASESGATNNPCE
ncbi:MAG: type II secretion system protein [Okeania sp. SIO2C9]|nr:type II secretion system protein [Okeania sp. SIO2C9]